MLSGMYAWSNIGEPEQEIGIGAAAGSVWKKIVATP